MKKNAASISLLLLLLGLTGCASIMKSATGKLADNLSTAVLNQNDLQTVRDGAPAFLLMIDGLIEGDPDNKKLLFTGSKLYSAYASAFVDDRERAKRLTQKSLNYAGQALCLHDRTICQTVKLPFREYQTTLEAIQQDDVAAVYSYNRAWASWLAQHADDWNAVADLPKLRITLERLLQLDNNHDKGGIYLMLAVLESQLPPSLGGKPDRAKQYFETANRLNEKNLMTRLLYAKHYARLVFDQQLHDSLLKQVLSSKTEQPGLTLMNTIAQHQAKELLASGKDYF